MPDPSTVDLRGVMIWGDGVRGQWIEPFAATVTVSESWDDIVSLKLQAGDAETGLKHVPHGERRPAQWSDHLQWMFTFEYEA